MVQVSSEFQFSGLLITCDFIVIIIFLTTIILHIFTRSIQCSFFFFFFRLRKWTVLVLQEQAAMTFNSYKSKRNTSSLRLLQKDPHLGRGREYNVLRVEKWKGLSQSLFLPRRKNNVIPTPRVSIFPWMLCLEPFRSGLWVLAPYQPSRGLFKDTQEESYVLKWTSAANAVSYSILLPAILLTRILSTVQNAV